MKLINTFTKEEIKDISHTDFNNWLNLTKQQNSYIFVLELNNTIIATGKIMIEYKFNNNLTKCGHIEDVVVHHKYRTQGYGKMIIKYLINIGIQRDCCKIILNCNEINIPFYEKCQVLYRQVSHLL
jgi:glucosamine-phosphate N-acetyltransferase